MNEDRKTQEDLRRELQHEKLRPRTVFDAMQEGFALAQIVVGDDGVPYDCRITEINGAFSRLTGVHDPVGKTARELFPEIDNAWIERFGRVAQTGKAEHFEAEGPSLEKWFDLYVYCPEPGTFGCVFADITERKRTEQALQESETLAQSRLVELESIYRNAPVGLCVLDADLRFVRINDRLAEINGATPEKHIGRTVAEVLPNIAKSTEAALRRVIETGKPIRNIEVTGTTPAAPGVVRTWLESWLPVFDRDGSVAGLNLVAQEMTESKRTNQELETLTATLEQRVEERTELAEARADQLRALAVQLFEAEERERKRVADLLHEDIQQLLAGARLQLQVAQKTAQHPALESVKQLIDESINKSRQLSHELSPSVLHHAGLGAALEWLAGQMKEQFDLTVTLSLDGADIKGDTSFNVFLFRAVQELLFNVSKHADTREAEVELRTAGNSVVTVVSDAGKGFDPQNLESTAGGGGLGLLSLRERASSIGGNLEIYSKLGDGSRFTLSVPRNKLSKPAKSGSASRGRRAAPSVEVSSQSTETTRILFADDHKVIRQALISMISGQPDIEVVGEASTGGEAIDLARELNPSVVVMDVSMPEIDGIEATRQIKAEMPHIRVIGLSMHDDEETERAMKEAGAEVFLNKAESSGHLLRAIYGILEE